jgi:hypothetical protein
MINLHKPKKKAVRANLNQCGAQMNHDQHFSQDSP